MEDNFTFNKKRLNEFLELMILKKMKVTWECESRIDGMSKELLVKMKQAGCVDLNLGVESGNAQVLRFLKKDITLDKVATVIEWCHDIGIHPIINMMIGLPNETDEDIEMSFDLIRKCKPFHVVANAYRPFPGTELFDYCIEHDLFSMPRSLEDWVEISNVHAFKHSLKGTDEDRLEKIMRRHEKMNLWRHRQRKIKEILFHRPLELVRPMNYVKVIRKLVPSSTH
jgi:radical SAM superfamily enzyme YgiQ (UPF0313 family)